MCFKLRSLNLFDTSLKQIEAECAITSDSLNLNDLMIRFPTYFLHGCSLEPPILIIVLEWCSILYNWGIQISSPIFPRSFPKRFWKKRTNSTVFYCRFFAEPPWHHSGTTALRRPRRPSLQGDHELDHGLLWVHHHLSPTAWIHQRVGFSPPVWRRKMQENKQNKQKHTLDDRMLATQS